MDEHRRTDEPLEQMFAEVGEMLREIEVFKLPPLAETVCEMKGLLNNLHAALRRLEDRVLREQRARQE